MTTESQIAGVRSGLADATRIVIKIGSSLLVDDESGLLNRLWLDSLADEIVRLRERGQQVLIVSSGAIALGRKYLGLEPAQRRLEEHQAAAAAGQVLLAHAYQDLLGDRNIRVAQVLLTLDDTENRRRYLNARSTLDTLLRLGAVPVINENDTVATHEIRYGDNDRLGARVAEMVSADCLVLLSDVDGLYDADPADNPQARLIEEVAAITRKIESLAGETSTAYGSGGMITKLKAARIAVAAGCATVIANGRQLQPIMAVEDGGPATWFIPRKTPLAARKQWIGGSLKSCGRLIVDAGAETALVKGSSLLPVGIVSVDGDFERGDAITVSNVEGREIACGLAAYSSHDARKISGRRSDEIEGLLGYAGRDEIIHRDDLVLLDG
ncbi:MAG: glutamate 5-kinase [Gammaproteobacteria bacterium]|jgi:glutamate 5-kinase|nr:glutamate 5-kinase [Gammaproteobacteria bacterium]MDP7296600.1 glutamate 5-kinase [Gammaproteobacteria bacterium]MDP7418490.1 glutamate 5-kinase [Gammaproteobacteria bacterium]MDP7659602.1 glutamate 5-kinase [Gammaproteobacteria bacterium]HJP37668.1 glutamate 5-kinase [Gammaproteobacteria bacterium]